MSAVKTAKSSAPVVDENSAGSEIDATAGEEAVKEVEKVDTHDSDDKVEKNSKVEKAEVAVTAPVPYKEETVDCNSLSLLLPVEGIPTSLEFPPKVHDTEGDKAVEVRVLFITRGIFSLLICSCSLSPLHFPSYFSPHICFHHFSPLLRVSLLSLTSLSLFSHPFFFLSLLPTTQHTTQAKSVSPKQAQTQSPHTRTRPPTDGTSSITLLGMLDDCISLLVHIVLPVLDKTGLQDDLRTPRLLRELKEYRILIGEYSKVSKGTVPDGWEGQEGLNSNFNDDLEREVILNDSWYLDTAAPVSSPFSPVSPATNVNLNTMEWGTNGDVFLNALALTQVPPSGWADVIEHMRFRLEMLVDDYEKGSAVSLHGASALGVCDRNAEVDLVVAIPSLSESSTVLLAERAELKKAISFLLPPHIEGITAAQFVLGTSQRYEYHIYRLILLFVIWDCIFFFLYLFSSSFSSLTYSLSLTLSPPPPPLLPSLHSPIPFPHSYPRYTARVRINHPWHRLRTRQ
jgi:hypothetical protein